MRAPLVCLLLALLLAGCSAPDAGHAETAGSAEDGDIPAASTAPSWSPDRPRIDATADVAGDLWTFRATITNPTGDPIWLTQRSCEVGAGVSIRNETHGGTSSTHTPGLACGWGPGLELAENATHRFEWTWNGTLLHGHEYVPAPAGAYDVTLWTAWAESMSYPQPVHGHDTRVTAKWSGLAPHP